MKGSMNTLLVYLGLLSTYLLVPTESYSLQVSCRFYIELVKTSGSESRGHEEAACMRSRCYNYCLVYYRPIELLS